jgi:2-oxoglutarate ferredoxin oxidoreductase subunit alpha
MDYASATLGGGQGGYKNIVLAPASVQEVHDLVQLAFYLADKYRNPVIVLSDGIIGTMMEPIELRRIDFGPLPEKDWALRGKGRQKDGQRRILSSGQGLVPTPSNPNYLSLLHTLNKKFQQMAAHEVRVEVSQLDDAEVALVAFGYTARVSLQAMNWARSEGIRVGMIRPITLWPFPAQIVKEQAQKGVKLLVVEDNLGQMSVDVRLAAEGKSEIHLVSALDRHEAMEGGAIYPEKVLTKIKQLVGK